MENNQESKFMELMNDLISHHKKLNNKLHEENEALRNFHSPTILQVIKEKQMLLDELLRTESQLKGYLDQHHDAASSEPLEALIQKHIKTADPKIFPKLNNLWNDLKERVFISRRQNTINGNVIFSSLKMTNAFIQAMTPEKNPIDNSTQKSKSAITEEIQ